MCDGVSCGDVQRCFGQQCFSSFSVRNGTAFQEKGCIVGSEERTIRCGSSLSSLSVDTVQCCQGTLCNKNVSMEMPSTGDSQAVIAVTHQDFSYRANYFLMINIWICDIELL